MAGSGNRGPNDFRGRNGKRRREPPIIDGSATEVPPGDDLPEGEPDPSEPAASAGGPASDPVLFGGARRVPEIVPAEDPADASGPGVTSPDAPAPAEIPAPTEAHRGEEPTIVPSALDGEPAPGEPAGPAHPEPSIGDPTHGAAATSDGESPRSPAADPIAAADAAPAVDATPDAGEALVPPVAEGPVPAAAAAPPPAAARSGGGALWLLGVSNLVLLGALAWAIYAAPGHRELADLRRQVATLEARPEASQLQGDVASLGQRVGAADADRKALAGSVADLTARLDGVAQAAQSAKADADKASSAAGAAQSDANRPPPTGAAAPATVGALAALAARIEGVDRGVSALSADQARTAKAVADLPKPVPPDFGPVNARVAGVETQLSGRIAALDGRLGAVDGKANATDARLNGFDGRVNAVEAKVNGADARMNGVDARTNALEAKLNDEAAGLARLRTAVADLPKVDLGPLQAATAGLDKRVAAVEGQLSAPKDGARVTTARAVGSADFDRATPIALVGEAVRRSIMDGRPYAADLDALKALGVAPETLARLRPLAAGGAPTAAALKAKWDATRDGVLAAVRPDRPGASAFDRLAGSAFSLVKVQKAGAVAGDDGAAVVTQVDAALDAGDVAGALAAWDRLPAAGQERSKDWADAARARVDAEGAARALVDRAIATLGKADE